MTANMAAPQSHNSTAAEHLFADYWAEYQDITTNKPTDEEEEVSKTPDGGEGRIPDLLKTVYLLICLIGILLCDNEYFPSMTVGGIMMRGNQAHSP